MESDAAELTHLVQVGFHESVVEVAAVDLFFADNDDDSFCKRRKCKKLLIFVRQSFWVALHKPKKFFYLVEISHDASQLKFKDELTTNTKKSSNKNFMSANRNW